MNIHTARCLRHPSESVVGVCGSCLKDRLTFLTSIKDRSFAPPALSVQLPSSYFQTGNGPAGRWKLLEGSNVCVESVESERKQQWRSKSLCERRYARVSLGTVPSTCGATSDGQFSRNHSRNKVTLRALFELDDLEQRKTKSADALSTDRCESVGEEIAKGCGDVGYIFKEPSCEGQEDAAIRPGETFKADEGSPGKSVCGAVCPASHGGKNAFWWVTLRWRRKGRPPKARVVEEETKSAACRKQAEDQVTGRTIWGWRRSKDTEERSAQGVGAAASWSTEAEEGAERRPAGLAAPAAGGQEEEGAVVPVQALMPESYCRPEYRSASCNASSVWMGPDYRTWEAYYSPAVAERLKPAAAILQRDVSRRGDRSYFERMRTVKISPGIADQGSLLRFYLTPLGTSSRRRATGRPQQRSSARGPWSFFFSR